MRVIGLTGTIGSGKSTVSAYIQKKGYPVIDADRIARQLMRRGAPGYFQVIASFEEDLLDENQEIDRKRLSKIVFKEKKKLEQLNNIMHPMILSAIEREIEYYRNQKKEVVFLDVPLLIEAGMKDLTDMVLLITVQEQILISRIIQRDRIKEEQVKAIIDAQMPVSEKKRFADVCISNDKDIDSLYHEIDVFLKNYGKVLITHEST